MSKYVMAVLLIVLTGCSYGADKFQSLVDEPGSIIRDPNFVEYETKKEALERRYLDKEITYAEYLEGKQQLEDQYIKEAEYYRTTVETYR